AVGVQPMPAERDEPRAGGVREPLDRVEIDAHVDLRRHLVHVLAARPRGAHGADVQSPVGHADGAGDDDLAAHTLIVSCARSTTIPPPGGPLYWISWPSLSAGVSRTSLAAPSPAPSTCAAQRCSTSTQASSTRPPSPPRAPASRTSDCATRWSARARESWTPPVACWCLGTSIPTCTRRP